MKYRLPIELTKPQTEWFRADEGYQNDLKVVAFISGLGGGKTMVGVMKLIQLCLRYPDHDILYLMPTFSMFVNVLYPTLYEVLDGTFIDLKINKTVGSLQIGHGRGRVILKSMQEPETLVGMNVFAVFIDEIDTMSQTKAQLNFEKSLARNRYPIPDLDGNGNKVYNEDGKVVLKKNKIYITSSPEGFGFLYQILEKDKEKHPDYFMVQASGEYNIHLPPDYYDSMRSLYSPELCKAYILGQFVNLTSGTVFSDFKRETCSSSEVHTSNEPIHVGVDFNVLGISAPVYVKRASLADQGKSNKNYNYNDKPTLHAVDHFQKITDTPELIQVIKDKYPNSKVTCYPDASGNSISTKGATLSDISMLRRAGFICKFPAKNPPIVARVLASNSAFKNGIVKVNIDKCPDLAEALEQQVYDQRTELPEKNAGPGTIDDITDSATYIIHYLYPIKRNTFRSSERKEG